MIAMSNCEFKEKQVSRLGHITINKPAGELALWKQHSIIEFVLVVLHSIL